MNPENSKNPYPPFTKDWFVNVWAYSKRYLILILLVFIGLIKYYTMIDNDIEIRLYGPEFNEKQVKALKSDFARLAEDTNGDGRTHLHLNIKTYADEYKNQLSKGKATLQILPEAIILVYAKNDRNSFTDLTQMAIEHNIPEDRLLKYDGKVCGIQIGGYKIFKDKNIFTPDFYIFIRSRLPIEERDKMWVASYENGVRAAEYLAENK